MRWIFATLLLASTAQAAPVCPSTAPAGVARIKDVMATGRFVAYQPTALKFFDGKPTQADAASIEADLKVLRPRFDGLITYSSINGAERVPEIAAKLGFRAVIMGIWDPANGREAANVAVAARRHPDLVVGVSVGNERVFAKEKTWNELAQAMGDVRKLAPALAVSTTEPFHILLEDGAALKDMDLLLPNIHPVFEPWFQGAPDANVAEFVVNVTNDLGKLYCGPILVKETGAPTAPASKGFTPARQAAIFGALQKQLPPNRTRAFTYFSAFDAPWRAHDANPVPGTFSEEAHFGLYDAARKPKPVVDIISVLK